MMKTLDKYDKELISTCGDEFIKIYLEDKLSKKQANIFGILAFDPLPCSYSFSLPCFKPFLDH